MPPSRFHCGQSKASAAMAGGDGPNQHTSTIAMKNTSMSAVNVTHSTEKLVPACASIKNTSIKLTVIAEPASSNCEANSSLRKATTDNEPVSPEQQPSDLVLAVRNAMMTLPEKSEPNTELETDGNFTDATTILGGGIDATDEMSSNLDDDDVDDDDDEPEWDEDVSDYESHSKDHDDTDEVTICMK